MKIVEPSVEVLRTGMEKDFMTPEQFIEKVGRTCYKSEDKITPESAPKFVRNLINRAHEAMLEHWTLIFRAKDIGAFNLIRNEWLNVTNAAWDAPVADDAFLPKLRFTGGGDRYIISGNIRAWRDFYLAYTRNAPNNRFAHYLQDIMDAAPAFFEDLRPEDNRPADYKPWLTPITVRDLQGDQEHIVHHDVTLKFVCDRGVSHELVRHRAASFAQESTRYCNYTQGKYGNEITVVRPSWCDTGSRAYEIWQWGCEINENRYRALISVGCAPQEARSILPNSLKTEVVVTGSMGHWNHFFGLRCGPEAQPDMREVACMARDLLESKFARKLG